ncbi:leucine-rich repeat domain-containing protein [Vibrio barjaei]|uniref:leucine-rich repeat domain-containing protein n=1 Tax=Vibrio barjaei TaxID=1676683 RepID=UPI002284CF69|nr:hypothetical protein [Vibrio barjaei]MCY9874791.1 hypothetical protein [Vibrio barjaei]
MLILFSLFSGLGFAVGFLTPAILQVIATLIYTCIAATFMYSHGYVALMLLPLMLAGDFISRFIKKRIFRHFRRKKAVKLKGTKEPKADSKTLSIPLDLDADLSTFDFEAVKQSLISGTPEDINTVFAEWTIGQLDSDTAPSEPIKLTEDELYGIKESLVNGTRIDTETIITNAFARIVMASVENETDVDQNKPITYLEIHEGMDFSFTSDQLKDVKEVVIHGNHENLQTIFVSLPLKLDSVSMFMTDALPDPQNSLCIKKLTLVECRDDSNLHKYNCVDALRIIKPVLKQHIAHTLPTQLKELYIESGEFDQGSLKSLSHCTDLKAIHFVKCSIKHIPQSVFSLSELELLRIHSTDITRISDNIRKLTKLKYLILDENKHLTRLPKHIGNLEFLEQLSFDRCDNLEVPGEIIELKALKTLQLPDPSVKNILNVSHVPCARIEVFNTEKTAKGAKYNLEQHGHIAHCIEVSEGYAVPADNQGYNISELSKTDIELHIDLVHDEKSVDYYREFNNLSHMEVMEKASELISANLLTLNHVPVQSLINDTEIKVIFNVVLSDIKHSNEQTSNADMYEYLKQTIEGLRYDDFIVIRSEIHRLRNILKAL